jgi:ABC-type glycerol-3-phosphate transport system substrate-binding protein
MKNKVLLLAFVIFLILALTGCGMVPPGESAETMAEQTVWDYWQAIINRQYELAKFYCIPDGVWYNKTDEWEEYINTNSEGEASLVIYGPVFYKPTEVIGEDASFPDMRDEAIVYARITTDITAFPGSFYHEGDTFEYEIELHKQNHPPGDWELK